MNMDFMCAIFLIKMKLRLVSRIFSSSLALQRGVYV